MLGRECRLLRIFARYQFLRDIQFRAGVFIRMLGNLAEFGFMLAFFVIIYANQLVIPGWTLPQALFLVGTYQLVNSIYLMFFTGIEYLSWYVERGDLDILLTKPIDAQFFVSLRRINYDAVFSLAMALIVVERSWAGMGQVACGWHWALYIVLVLAAVLLKYAAGLIIMTISFWATRIEALYYLFLDFFTISQYPADIFKGAARFVFTFIVPVAVVANVPASVLLGTVSLNGVASALAVTAVFLVLGRAFWLLSLRRYSSASS